MKFGYAEFTPRNAEIIAVGPDRAGPFKRYWEEHSIPFVGLPDPEHLVSKMYRQEVNIFKLGRMPMNCIVDMSGRIRYVHYGSSMSDIPDNETFINVIDEINRASG
jgi:peroxiredoxin Q/BCP